MIKNRIKNLSLSATLKINEISKNLEKEGKKIIRNIKKLILINLKMFGIMEIMLKEKKMVGILYMEDQMPL